MHLGLYCTGPLCTTPLVSSVNSRGAPCRSSMRTSVSKGGKLGREMANRFCLGTQLPCNHKGYLTCHKSATRANGFTSLLKDGMLRIFTPKKIRRLWPGLNPWTRVPEASMLTTRPPKLLLPSVTVGKLCQYYIFPNCQEECDPTSDTLDQNTSIK
jgi:hypothetical protein